MPLYAVKDVSLRTRCARRECATACPLRARSALRCGLLKLAICDTEDTASERTPMQWHDGPQLYSFPSSSLGTHVFEAPLRRTKSTASNPNQCATAWPSSVTRCSVSHQKQEDTASERTPMQWHTTRRLIVTQHEYHFSSDANLLETHRKNSKLRKIPCHES